LFRLRGYVAKLARIYNADAAIMLSAAARFTDAARNDAAEYFPQHISPLHRFNLSKL